MCDTYLVRTYNKGQHPNLKKKKHATHVRVCSSVQACCCNETGLRHRVSPCRSAYFASPWWLLTLISQTSKRNSFINPRVVMTSDDAVLARLFFYDNPEYKRHPNYTKTDQLPISEVITGLSRPYHHTADGHVGRSRVRNPAPLYFV